MKILGHPVHQMLIVFPVGLLITAFVFDILGGVSGNPDWWRVTYWLIPAGVIGGLIAAVFGFLDWRSIPAGTRARSIGLMHGGGNVLVVLLFAASWFARPGPAVAPGTTAFVLALLGTGLLLVTGWLGGELVVRHGIGVDREADPDAPSSLRTDTGTRPTTTPTHH